AVSAWQDNAAGFHFNEFYGFGRVDVSAAVEMAKNYSQKLGEYVVTEWQSDDVLNKPIPDASITGAADAMTVEDDLIIEAVQIEVTA
ncbi:peptidase S8, partial [Shewanella sp. A3A]|nr:peptidase S8 [Shewanella ferrihydritica]